MTPDKLIKYRKGNFELKSKHIYAKQKLENIRDNILLSSNLVGGAKSAVIIDYDVITKTIEDEITKDANIITTFEPIKKKIFEHLNTSQQSNPIVISLINADNELTKIFNEFHDLKSNNTINDIFKKNLIKIQKNLFKLQVKIIFSNLKKIEGVNINQLLVVINKKIEMMNNYIENQDSMINEVNSKEPKTVREIAKQNSQKALREQKEEDKAKAKEEAKAEAEAKAEEEEKAIKVQTLFRQNQAAKKAETERQAKAAQKAKEEEATRKAEEEIQRLAEEEKKARKAEEEEKAIKVQTLFRQNQAAKKAETERQAKAEEDQPILNKKEITQLFKLLRIDINNILKIDYNISMEQFANKDNIKIINNQINENVYSIFNKHGIIYKSGDNLLKDIPTIININRQYVDIKNIFDKFLSDNYQIRMSNLEKNDKISKEKINDEVIMMFKKNMNIDITKDMLLKDILKIINKYKEDILNKPAVGGTITKNMSESTRSKVVNIQRLNKEINDKYKESKDEILSDYYIKKFKDYGYIGKKNTVKDVPEIIDSIKRNMGLNKILI